MSQGFTQLSPEDPEFIGGWKLTGRVGHGGFGTIYVGTKDGLTAAIKLISREAIEDQESIPRFANEVRSLKKLNHPGIPKLIDHNLNRITPSISPFIAVEYFEGETFQSYLDQKKPINEQLWLEYLKSLIEILIYCHDKGIIHRDISPSNIIVTKDGPKLIDFGFSYLKGSERLSQKDVTVGTPPFRSPEHYAGEPVDAMDVFSLASVFVFIANGTYPFIAELESRYMDKICHDAPDLQGISENQKSLLTPLFYKDSTARPALEDIMQGIAELQFTKQLNTYKRFLKNSDKKLRSQKQNNLAKTSIARFLSVIFIALISIIGLISLLSRQSAEASDCDKLFKDASYEEAITACAFEVSKGNQKFQITLGKAYKRANQIDEAKEVFAKCKDQYFECLHENAFFVVDVNQARKDWKKAYENGVVNSSWALAISYNKSGETATANSWIDIAVAANNPIGKFMKSAQAYADKDYKTSLEIAKSLIGEDISDYPSEARQGVTIEKWILAIYDITKDEVGRKKFLEECATNNAYCIGTLSRAYLGEDDVKAKIWAEKGVELNNAESMWVMGRLAELRYFGTPEEKSADTTKARYWYKRAAERGDVSGMFRTADFADLDKRSDDACLWSNRLISKIDLRKGTWDERLGDASWKETASKIIQKYKCGLTVEPVESKPTPSPQSSITKPITVAEQARITKIDKYVSEANDFYESGDLEKAKKFSLLAAKEGSAEGMYKYGFILDKQGDSTEAIVWLKKAADLKYIKAYHVLGDIYYDKKDYAIAKSWWNKGVTAGNLSSMYNLALQYEKEKQPGKAEQLYLKAANLGHINSMFNLAGIYQDLSQLDKAETWYKKSLAGGQKLAAYNLALLYEDLSDWVKATQYFQIAADNGDRDAMYGLAYHLEAHFKNTVDACIWYKKAADLGQEAATSAFDKVCKNKS